MTEGRVEKRPLEAGARVAPDTVLIELGNPQLEQETVDAEWDWKAEESSYADLKVKLERDCEAAVRVSRRIPNSNRTDLFRRWI